ncbi:MAG: hypothetical protein ACYC39_09495 [Thiobacillus sp.]
MEYVDREQLNDDELTDTLGVVIECSRCGSSHVQSVPVVVAHGTHVVETETCGAGGSGGRTTKVTRSLLAEELAAPDRPSAWPGVILSAFSFVLIALLLEALALPYLLIHFVGLVGAAVAYHLYSTLARGPKLAAWNVERERWEKEFFCHKCGNRFIP